MPHLLLASLFLCILLFNNRDADAAEAEPIELGGGRQLFFGDRLVESGTGVKKIWHAARKFAGNPVLVREKPWEGNGPYLYGTALFDPAEHFFKLWYNCYVGGRPDYWTCYATSKDGLHWERPLASSLADPRLPERHNVVLLGSGREKYRQALSPSVLLRPDEPDPQRRYAMTYWDVNAGRPIDYLGLCVAFSPDGVQWKNVPQNPVFEGASDVTDCCYDPRLKKYLLHYKMWRVDGKPLKAEGLSRPAGDVSYWAAWDAVPTAGGGVRFEGRLVDYSAADPQPVKAAMEFAREPASRRVVARAESEDLIHWRGARLVLELPEKGDDPGLSTYGMPVSPYAGAYVGLLRVMHDERQIDVELAVSDDDLAWRRPNPGQPFLSLGGGNAFDAGMVFAASPVEVGDELWFYYGAFTGHHAVADKDQSIATGLAKLRRDGFVSYDAGESAGELMTRLVRIQGDALRINAQAEGEIRIELRAADGKPLTGYSFADCDPFRGDAVNQQITWKGQSRLAGLPDGGTRIAFRLQRASLYAFEIGK